jgi:hypothetical protein
MKKRRGRCGLTECDVRWMSMVGSRLPLSQRSSYSRRSQIGRVFRNCTWRLFTDDKLARNHDPALRAGRFNIADCCIGRQSVRNSQEFEVGKSDCLQRTDATTARMAIHVITVAESPQVPDSRIQRSKEEQVDLVDEQAGRRTT